MKIKRILAWALWAVTIVEAVLCVYLAGLNHLAPVRFIAEFVVAMAAAALFFATAGALITLNRPENRVGWLLSISGLGFGFLGWIQQYTRYALVTHPGALPGGELAAWLSFWCWIPITASVAIFLPLFFPNGRLPSPRWRPLLWLGVCAVILLVVSLAIGRGPVDDSLPEVMNPLVLPGAEAISRWLDPLATALILASLAATLAASVVRFYRSVGVERQQLKWFTLGIAVLVGSLVIPPLLSLPDFRNDTLKSGIAQILGFSLLPVTVGIAVLRHRLYDIDLIIKRTLVYGLLTGSVIAVYVFVVGYLAAILRVQNNLLISLVATGVVAVLFQPLRDALQRLVNRLLYGERDDPYTVLSRLGEHLEATLTPDSVLPAIVRTVKDSLRLPFAAIAIQAESSGDSPFAAAAGQPGARTQTLPLVYQHETVGHLVLGLRPGEDDFSPSDHRLLTDLTRQAGIAVYAVHLTRDLQQAREWLVNAREEERRRIRRDLHDGLGSSLAALHLQAMRIRSLVQRNPPDALVEVDEWRASLRSAIADIRRLVYDLRPPALDELGLVDAVRTRAAQCSSPTALCVRVDAPEQLPPLPAAVEVAAYRIVEEALANVAHHAQARECVIRMQLNHGLSLTISDNGIGLPPAYTAGAGLHSMHTRAVELGGSCLVQPLPEGGTQVRAWLPLTGNPPSGDYKRYE